MISAQRDLLRKALWTLAGYGGSLAIRLGTSVILSRLLNPEILGVMVILHTVRFGIELLSDIGIEQNIVRSQSGATYDFVNTAWTLQIIRGVGLSCIFLALAFPLSMFYGVDLYILAIFSVSPFINSLHSTSIFLLVRDMKVGQRNLFEFGSEVISLLLQVGIVLISPTVPALLFAIIASIAVRSAISYALPHPGHRLMLRGDYAREVLKFGKWIMISSVLVYAALNVDKLYLGAVLPLGVLGIYGLARTISDLPANLAGRLGYQIVFPTMAAIAKGSGGDLGVLRASRFQFVLLAAVVMGVALSSSDWAVHILYDERYRAAGVLLFILLIGTWFAVLSGLNEAALLGHDRPAWTTAGNTAKLVVLSIALPIGYWTWGIAGTVMAVPISELARYAALLVGQQRVGYTFARQDLISTMVFFTVALVLWVVRGYLGLGHAWDSFYLLEQIL